MLEGNRRCTDIEKVERAYHVWVKVTNGKKKIACVPDPVSVVVERSLLRHLNPAHSGHRVGGWLVPPAVGDVGLVHHVVPLAVEQFVIVLIAEGCVVVETPAYLVGIGIGSRIDRK